MRPRESRPASLESKSVHALLVAVLNSSLNQEGVELGIRVLSYGKAYDTSEPEPILISSDDFDLPTALSRVPSSYRFFSEAFSRNPTVNCLAIDPIQKI